MTGSLIEELLITFLLSSMRFRMKMCRNFVSSTQEYNSYSQYCYDRYSRAHAYQEDFNIMTIWECWILVYGSISPKIVFESPFIEGI